MTKVWISELEVDKYLIIHIASSYMKMKNSIIELLLTTGSQFEHLIYWTTHCSNFQTGPFNFELAGFDWFSNKN